MREKHIETTLTAQAKKRGGLALKFTSPGTTGVPDRLVILPPGRLGFVETKTTGDTPRPIQKHRIQQLKNLGCRVYVIDHTDQIPGVLNAIQAP